MWLSPRRLLFGSMGGGAAGAMSRRAPVGCPAADRVTPIYP